MADPILFDRDLLLTALAELDRELARHQQLHQEMIVVGGSYLALEDLRQSTRDVDVVTQLTVVTRRAIGEVATELGLSAQWLNDEALAFRPSGLTSEHCTAVFAGSALTILAPSADWIFLMKLRAVGRAAIDRPDMIKLWPLAKFASPGEAVERFWDAYPEAPDDAYLGAYVAGIAQAASP